MMSSQSSSRVLQACALASLVVLSGTPAAAQDSFEDAFWQFRTLVGVDYSTGSYGAATNTDVIYSYASLRAAKGPWTLKLVVPWMRVSGPAVLLDGASSGAVGTTTTRDVSGIGDISVAATYAVRTFYDRGLFIDLGTRVKIPTASFAKGLGTGEADAAAQIDVAQAWGKFMPFIAFGYKASGRPKGYHLRDVVYGTAGLQYNVTDTFTTGVMFDYRQASLRAAEDPREGTAYLNVKFAQHWAANLYAVAGFSRNSPAAGGGAVITYRW